nr:MAG: DNA pilot protein [Microvirus sp.]
MGLLESGINAGAGLIQGVINAATSKRNTRRTIDANKELAEYQYSKDLQMWNIANEYNSPQSQMSRLKKAGLNPNLVYGTGAVANSTGNLPKYSAPTVKYDAQPMQIGGVLSAFMDMKLKQAQIDNIEAQTKATQVRTVSEGLTGQTKEFDLNLARKLESYSLEAKKLGNQQLSKNLERIALDMQNMQKQGKNLDTEQEIKQQRLIYDRYTNELNRIGVNRSDNVLLRMFVKNAQGSSIAPEKLIQKAKEYIESIMGTINNPF